MFSFITNSVSCFRKSRKVRNHTIDSVWAGLRPAHDMHMRIRGACPHDVRSGRLMVCRKASRLGIKWPHDHPVRTNLDRRAGLIVRITVAPLFCPCQHVGDSRNSIRRLRQMVTKCVVSLLRSLVLTHRRIRDRIRIARHTHPAVGSWTKYLHFSGGIDFRDCRVFCDLHRAGGYGARNLGLE